MMMNDRTLPDIQDPDCVTPLARVHEVFGRWLGKTTTPRCSTPCWRSPQLKNYLATRRG